MFNKCQILLKLTIKEIKTKIKLIFTIIFIKFKINANMYKGCKIVTKGIYHTLLVRIRTGNTF